MDVYWFGMHPYYFLFSNSLVFLDCIYERKVAIEKMERIIPYFKQLCMLPFILVIPVSLGYITILKNKGYASCQQTPSGWMPGLLKNMLLIRNCVESELVRER